MPPDPALWLTLINSNYPCLEQIFMVPEVLEPLKFYCIPFQPFKDLQSILYVIPKLT